MAAPFLVLCRHNSETVDKYLKTPIGGKIGLGTIAFDMVAFITTLVVGILGLQQIHLIGMPPAAAYALVGISGVIGLTWIALLVSENCKTKSGYEIVD